MLAAFAMGNHALVSRSACSSRAAMPASRLGISCREFPVSRPKFYVVHLNVVQLAACVAVLVRRSRRLLVF